MFAPPRVVVVDDKPEHLSAIREVFQRLGTPCLGLTYDPAQDLDPYHLRGVRVLLLDLHLTEQMLTSDYSRHYGIIAGILKGTISPTGGPFILVVWTEHDDAVPGLIEYLDESMVSDKPHARPLAVVGLPKGEFIDLPSGDLLPEAMPGLREAIREALSDPPQLGALLEWESDVQAAAGATLSALNELVPEDRRTAALFSPAIDEIMSQLADAAVGSPNVANDPRAAFSAALAPILADRIVNQKTTSEESDVWPGAITQSGRGLLAPDRSGKVNRMLHLAMSPSETIEPTDWGAVVEFPDGWWTKTELRDRFGVTGAELLGQEFKIPKSDRARCRPRLVRVGAVCDYAQRRAGPLPYMLGLEIPHDVERQSDDTGAVRRPASEWCSPLLLVDGDLEPFVLAVNSRYLLTVTPRSAQDWTPAYRLREQLLMHLISHGGGHMTRPGIISL